MVMQSSITSVFRQRNERGRNLREGLEFGSTLKFVPGKVSQRFLSWDALDRLRFQPRIGVRAPRIALVSFLNFLLFRIYLQEVISGEIDKLSVISMKMLHWMCGKIRRDRIRNYNIREREREGVGVTPIVEKISETTRCRRFGHVE